MVPFTAETRMGGLLLDGQAIMKGAVDPVVRAAISTPPDLRAHAERIAREGGTPLAASDNGRILGLIYLKDTVKPGVKERFHELRRMGIRTVMVTGDNRLTAATIARQAGVDDFVAEAKPENEIDIIRAEQAQGKLAIMAVAVVDRETLTAEQQKRLREHLTLAEDLGIETHEMRGAGTRGSIGDALV